MDNDVTYVLTEGSGGAAAKGNSGGGGGGGGGGRGYSVNGGGGGGGGGLASAQGKSLGGDGLVLASGGSGGAAGSHGADGGDAFSEGGGLYANRTADGGEGGYENGNAGATSAPDNSIDTKPSAGSNGSKTTVSLGTTYYPWVFKDGFTGETISYAMVKSTASPTYPSYPTANHCGFTGWSGVSTHFNVLKVVTANYLSHNYSYSASGTTITATCKNSGCYLRNGGSVTLNNPGDAFYSGSSHVATTSGSFLRSLGTPTLSYAYNESGASNYTAISGSPIKPGYYQATLTAPDGVTAVSVSFRIYHNYTYNGTTLQCGCGMTHPNAVASVSKNGKIIDAYTTLKDAVSAVSSATAADRAVLTLLKDINLGTMSQSITSGVFTIDLNGNALSTAASYGLVIENSGANVTITDSGKGGTVSGTDYGVYATNSSTVTVSGGTVTGQSGICVTTGAQLTVSGGSIYGLLNDILYDYGYITLTLGENGIGATFPGGIEIYGKTTLNAILGEGCAYWAGDTMVTVADGVKAIDNMGDITIMRDDAVATVSKNGMVTDAYTTLNDAIQAVKNCTAADQAVVTLLKDINLGSSYQTISSGVFTIDLNGCELSSTKSNYGVLYINGSTAYMTIQDSGEDGKISGNYAGIEMNTGTLTVLGGTISGKYGVDADGSTVTISGGSISGDSYDIYNSNSTITLTTNENGIGATFPGGIQVAATTLNAILGDGAAYWAGDIMLTDVTGESITDKGDITIMRAGAVAVVSKNGVITGAYTTLNSAIQAVANCTADDQAVVTLLKDIKLGNSYQEITGGVFTISLNGRTLSCTSSGHGTLYLNGSVVDVTVTDFTTGGTISGVYAGIEVVYGAKLTVSSGSIDGYAVGVILDDGGWLTVNGGTVISNHFYGVRAWENSSITINGGTVSGDNAGVCTEDCTVTISGGNIIGSYEGVYAYNSTVTISGGSISGDSYDIYNYNSTITLTLGENGVGATFPNGITVYKTTLNNILGEGAAYWQGDKQLFPADDSTEITGGDVVIKAYIAPSGWTEIGGNWYYYDPDTHTPVTGIARVPYPTEAINGVTYGPNMEDVKYANDKGTLFKDSISAFFVFDENGVFQSGLNGLTTDNRWAVNGCIVWHVGLVQIGEDYYYFIGDVDNGGNKMATGDVYVGRNTTGLEVAISGIYTFGSDGRLCMYDGITEAGGILRYYENARLMIGAGLIQVEDSYYYVLSDGSLVLGTTYYVEKTNSFDVPAGSYEFDAEGKLLLPDFSKNGVYAEEGGLFYYENGKRVYKGLIRYTDGENYNDSWIYVRSNGQLAVGRYYVTNHGSQAEGFCLFDSLGRMLNPKNGIVEENGGLYYYVNGSIQYGAGPTAYEGGWVYVRSNGQVAVGRYWITKTNGNLPAGYYDFGEDGMMLAAVIKDGIVEENGGLFYYRDGVKQYGAGLTQLSDGSYIYVRSNGQLATGKYWITNHKGLLPEGEYTFGTDGKLTF